MSPSSLCHKQSNSDVTGGYRKRVPEWLREPAQQVEGRLMQLAKVGSRGKPKATGPSPAAG
jgi:hypothetical protein